MSMDSFETPLRESVSRTDPVPMAKEAFHWRSIVLRYLLIEVMPPAARRRISLAFGFPHLWHRSRCIRRSLLGFVQSDTTSRARGQSFGMGTTFFSFTGIPRAFNPSAYCLTR